jgi:plasmid maintenance system antidote protein VapI
MTIPVALKLEEVLEIDAEVWLFANSRDRIAAYRTKE